MIPKQLDIDLEFDSFSVSGSFPLEGLSRAFEGLVRRNAESRARDEDPSLRPYFLVRIQCPFCAAPVFQLTAVERDGERLRACRCCRAEFPVGV